MFDGWWNDKTLLLWTGTFLKPTLGRQVSLDVLIGRAGGPPGLFAGRA